MNPDDLDLSPTPNRRVRRSRGDRAPVGGTPIPVDGGRGPRAKEGKHAAAKAAAKAARKAVHAR